MKILLMFLLLTTFVFGQFAGFITKFSTFIPTTTYNPINENVVLFLRADKGITITGTGVSEWVDQSAQVNTVVQSTDKYRPAFSTNKLVFTAADTNNLSKAAPVNSNDFGVGDFAIEVYAKPGATNGRVVNLYQGSANVYWSLFLIPSLTPDRVDVKIRGNGDTEVAPRSNVDFTDGLVHYICANIDRTANTITIYDQNVISSSGALSIAGLGVETVTNTSADYDIGVMGNVNYYEGDLYVVRVTKGATISATERANFYSWLQSKF